MTQRLCACSQGSHAGIANGRVPAASAELLPRLQAQQPRAASERLQPTVIYRHVIDVQRRQRARQPRNVRHAARGQLVAVADVQMCNPLQARQPRQVLIIHIHILKHEPLNIRHACCDVADVVFRSEAVAGTVERQIQQRRWQARQRRGPKLVAVADI